MAAGVAITPDGAETGSALGLERHRMRRIREVLRLKYKCGLSHRSVSASTGTSKGSVSDYLRRADEAGLPWELARELRVKGHGRDRSGAPPQVSPTIR